MLCCGLSVLQVVLLSLVARFARGIQVSNDIADAVKHSELHVLDNEALNSLELVNRRAVRGQGQVAGQSSSPTPTTITTRPNIKYRGICRSKTTFRCDNGECISKSFLCDGGRDCNDGSDEKNCPQSKDSKGKCLPNYFLCNNMCFPEQYRCDGSKDCQDGSDEKGCDIKCPSGQYKCRDGPCIVHSALCDGYEDCEHGDDEKNCERAHCLAIAGYYQCDSGDCVPPVKVCNNETDCLDGTDEGIACATTCSGSNCTQACYPTPKGPHCSCEQGFNLESDLRTCSDVDECALSHVLACDHFCKNTAGAFQCSCHRHYVLQTDNVTCKHEGSESAFLLVAQEDGIRQLYLDGSRNVRIAYSKNASTIGLGYDPVTRYIFWSSFGNVFKAPLVPDAVSSSILRDGIIAAEGLAVDWTGRNLYLTDPKMSHILVCALDGSSCYQLLGKLGHPRAIQLDMANRRMYWTDVRDGTIRLAGMDGSGHDVLVMNGLVWPNAMALDLPAERIYWLDANTDEAASIRLDGTDQKSLHLAVVHHPFSLAVWEDHLYWTDWTKVELTSAIKRNGKHGQIILKGVRGNQYFGLSLYHPAMREDITNPCASARCSHLCLLSPLSPGYACACPSGVMELDQDRHTCVDLPGRTYLVVNSFKKLYLVTPHRFGRSEQHAFVPDLDVEDMDDVEYCPEKDMLLVSDRWKRKVYGIAIKTGRITTVMENMVVPRMALDWLRHNLYWLSSRQVLVAKLEAGVATVFTAIIYDLASPVDLAVAPLLGYLFVASTGTSGSAAYIRRCGLDGSHCTVLVHTGIERPVALIMDNTNNHLYWSDQSLLTVERITADGKERVELVSSHKRHVPRKKVVSMVVTDDRLLLTLEDKPNIYAIATNTSYKDFQIMELDLDPLEDVQLGLTRIDWKPPITEGKRLPCYENGGCSEICVGNATHDEVCICGLSSKLGEDGKTCEKEGCKGHMFQCVNSSECVPQSFRCDGVAECPDGSDEAGCVSECPPNHYQCNATIGCVHQTKVCDGFPDCDDGSDEAGPCPQNSTTCHGHVCDGTKCLMKILVCDGHADCKDESDEAECNITCSANHAPCRSGYCIPKAWFCDGGSDCHDGSDEENCTFSCPADHISCDDDKCISNYETCNGKPDCKDGSDELPEMCGTPGPVTCPLGTVACMTDRPELVCIDEAKMCDDVQDCPLGDDENVHSCLVCHVNEFQCPLTNTCIPLSYVCDGEANCIDGADEGSSANCTVSTTTSSPSTKECREKMCEQKCVSTPQETFCTCSLGSHLAPDGRSCLDDSECKNEGLCSQLCEDHPGGFICVCLPGYEAVDRTTCKREDGVEWVAVLGEKGLLNITHQEVFSVVPQLDGAASATVDPVTGSILFSDRRREVVAMLTKHPGGEVKETVLWRRNNPGPVCIDPHRRNVYVVETFGEGTAAKARKERSVTSPSSKRRAGGVAPWFTIMACNLDDKGCGLVYGSNSAEVQSMAVALREERLLFCTKFLASEGGLIMMSYLDGTEMHVIRRKLRWCGSVAVDEAKRRVYWTDLVLNTVESVTWEGGSHRYVGRWLDQVWYPVGLAVVGANVTWANRGNRTLFVCPKTEGDCSQVALPFTPRHLFTAPMAVAPERDRCANVSCSQMCASGGSCGLCRINYQRSSADPTKCEKLSTCDGEECGEGSECEAHTSDQYVCRCRDGRYGPRCEAALPSNQGSEQSGSSTVVVVVVLLVVVVAVLVCIYWWKRRPFTIWKRRGRGAAEQGYHFVNPAFGVMHDQPIIDEDDSPRNRMYAQQIYVRPEPSAPDSTEDRQQNLKNGSIKEINTSGDSAVASTTDSLLGNNRNGANMEEEKNLKEFKFSNV